MNVPKELVTLIYNYKHILCFDDALQNIFAKHHPLFSILQNKNLFVPLQFWFNRNPNLILPPIALQYNHCYTDLLYFCT